MRRTASIVAAVIGTSLLAAPLLMAQAEPPGPPPILSIYREVMKPGKGAAHEKNEAAWAGAYSRTSAPINYIAMTSVTGPDEAWFLEGRDNFATVEKGNQFVEGNPALEAEIEAIAARDGELVSSSSHMLAVLRKDLSYRAGAAIPTMRYFTVTTIRVKPGYANDFAAHRKLINEAHDKAKMDERWAIYEVISGAPGGTFLVFQPMKSLAEMDGFRELHGKEYEDALGEEGRTRVRDLSRDAIQSTTNQVFRFNPKMSTVSREFAGKDPAFWTPKPAEPIKKK
jgi:hypothetical protein